jgi:xanthine dehydrogenase YagT iron-sulfur-binding subunit
VDVPISLSVDGQDRRLSVDPRVTLLDALRDYLGVMSPKKGCDHGQCGACTVLADGRRVLACLTLAVAADGAEIVTAAGLADGGDLHPVAQAFLDHDGLQCGYCTPGQICSAIGMLQEMKDGHPSVVTEDLTESAELSEEEIRERMSGNLCRCGAYVNIVAAIRAAAGAEPAGTGGQAEEDEPAEEVRGPWRSSRATRAPCSWAAGPTLSITSSWRWPDRACWWTSAACRWTASSVARTVECGSGQMSVTVALAGGLRPARANPGRRLARRGSNRLPEAGLDLVTSRRPDDLAAFQEKLTGVFTGAA